MSQLATPVVDMRGIWKTYGMSRKDDAVRVDALRGVDLTVQDGEFTAIIGPSGSGKSTLMHIIGCLDTPTQGTYLIDGEDASDLTEEDLAEIRNHRIGFVFQQFNLLASLSAWRNVELPLAYGRVPAAKRRTLAMEALAKVGLTARANHKPGEMSGGQQQRVAVARALVTNPSLLLADEPTGNLDSVSSADTLKLFAELNREGRTIILITHDPGVAASARRVVQVRDGQITSDKAVEA
ncbi:MAG: ABC transporter ATP-binding protein [Propionibacteriaceae bacterium]|jgi:putative ABC transport system ATP-binding protein|nr:ABC transporter ATP-binding protein [Propionibacteriaceae bacterium]